MADFNLFKKNTQERIANLERQLKTEETKASSLATSVQSVKEKAESLERTSLDKILEIQGLPATELDDPQQAAILVSNAIDCQLDSQDFDCSISARSSTSKVLKISFASKTGRDNFLVAGKVFNRLRKRVKIGESEHKIYVNEALTNIQKKLLYNAKSFAREFHYMCAWFVNGNVHLKKAANTQPIIIRTQAQIEELNKNEVEGLLPERPRNSLENESNSASNQIQQL